MNPEPQKNWIENTYFYGKSVLLRGKVIYFLSGKDGQFQDEKQKDMPYKEGGITVIPPKRFTPISIPGWYEEIDGRLYSKGYELDIHDHEETKVVNLNPGNRATCYVVSPRWFIEIYHSHMRPVTAEKGPVPFTPFPEWVNMDNFEQKLHEYWKNRFNNVGLPENPVTASERPKKWPHNFQENMLRLWLNIDDTLIGKTVVIKTASGSVYDLKITDIGLQGVTARIAGIVFNGFLENWSLVETRTGKHTSPVDKVLWVR